MTDQTVTTETPQVAETGRSMGQTYYEDVEALKQSGTPNAEAVRQVAEAHGKPIGSVRGGIYQYKTRLDGGNGGHARNRKSGGSVDDCLSRARVSLESALKMIDTEVETARISFETAKAHYEQVQASVKDRKTDIEKKIKALA